MRPNTLPALFQLAVFSLFFFVQTECQTLRSPQKSPANTTQASRTKSTKNKSIYRQQYDFMPVRQAQTRGKDQALYQKKTTLKIRVVVQSVEKAARLRDPIRRWLVTCKVKEVIQGKLPGNVTSIKLLVHSPSRTFQDTEIAGKEYLLEFLSPFKQPYDGRLKVTRPKHSQKSSSQSHF